MATLLSTEVSSVDKADTNESLQRGSRKHAYVSDSAGFTAPIFSGYFYQGSRVNPSFGEVRAAVFFELKGRGGRAGISPLPPGTGQHGRREKLEV
eukprot:scaffold7468_cov82-Skeletonema_marinoi.AAC.2